MALGYGVDLWCDSRLQTARYARGSRALAQALFRRLTTPRGSLRGTPEAEAYGLDISQFIGSASQPIVLASIPSQVRAELAKDDRILATEVTVYDVVTSADGLSAIMLEIQVTPADETEDFSMTVSVDRASGVVLMGVV